jgi:hypothetical protein
MSTLTLDDLKTLSARHAGWCVSIYLPTHRASVDTRRDQLEYKHLLRSAEEQLLANGMRANDARGLLAPAQQLASDAEFWHNPTDGMAVFAADGLFSAFHLPLVPPGMEGLALVAQRFHVKPLLPLLRDDTRFYVLGLSQRQTRLWRSTPYGIAEVTPDQMPQSLAEALRYEEPERILQFHTVGSSGGGGPVAIFHGHGVGSDDSKDRIVRYFQQVERAIHRLLLAERAALLLAGVEYLLPLYRQVNTYPHLLAEALTGNPEELTPEELHRAAWSRVAPHFAAVEREALASYQRHRSTERASGALDQIIPASVQGRVETLLVALGTERWGIYDPADGELVLHETPQPGDEDMLDFAALHTLLTGGRVHTFPAREMPDRLPLAAVFRY